MGVVVIDGGRQIFLSTFMPPALLGSDILRLLLWLLCACDSGGTRVICKFGSVIFWAANAADGNVSAVAGIECAFCIVVDCGKRKPIGSVGSHFSTVKSMQLYSVAWAGNGIKSFGLPKMRVVRLYIHCDWNFGSGTSFCGPVISCALILAFDFIFAIFIDDGGTFSAIAADEP